VLGGETTDALGLADAVSIGGAIGIGRSLGDENGGMSGKLDQGLDLSMQAQQWCA